MRPRIEIAEDGGIKVMEEKVDRRGSKIPKGTIGKRPVASSIDQDKTISLDTQNTESEESWIPLKYHSSSSKASANCLKKLMAAKHADIPSTVKQSDYLNSIFLKKENDSMMQKLQSLSQLPLEERLKKWLCKGDSQAFKFSALKCLAPEASAEEVIEILKKYAVLVQGLWVPKNTTIQLVSEATPRKALARDYVILKFSKKLKFTYQELDGYKNTMRISLIEALNGLGKDSEVLKSWKLKEPADPSFEKQYPSVAKQQKQLIEAHQPEIMSQMKNFRKNEKEGATMNARLPDEKQEALSKALRLVFKDHSVHSLDTIGTALRDMAVSASLQNPVDKNWMKVAATCADAPVELKCFLDEFATVIQGFYVAKSSPTNPELNPLRNVVIQLLQGQPPNGKLKKAQIIKAAELSLKVNVSDNDYLKVMSELCDSSSNGWMLKKPK